MKRLFFLLLLILGSFQLLAEEKNLISNPSFEKKHAEWAADWFIRSYHEGNSRTRYVYDTGEGHHGDHYLTVTNLYENDARIYQYVSVIPLTVYRISVWIKAENCKENLIGANISVPDSFAISNNYRDTDGHWKEAILYGMTDRSQHRLPIALRLGAYNSYTTGTASFDDVRVEVAQFIPRGATVQRLNFNDNRTQEEFDNAKELHLRRVKNRFHNSKTTPVSIFYAIFLFSCCLLSVVYFFVFRNKFKILDKIIETALKRFYILLLALFFLTFLAVYFNNHDQTSLLDVQLSFIIALLAVIGIGIYLFSRKLLKIRHITLFIIALGIVLRICYFLYTNQHTRQHDIFGSWGHIDYIKYIADNFSLPQVGTYENYHPPVHYILSAGIYNIGKLFLISEEFYLRLIQGCMVFISSVTLIIFYKIFKEFNCKNFIILIGVAVLAFQPNAIYMSAYLNNDTVMFLLYTLSFYNLIKWVNKKRLKNIIVMALLVALTILTKKSSLVIYPVIGLVFLVELLKNKKEWKTYIKQYTIFFALALPLSMIYQIRNYLLFQHDLQYSVPPFGPIMRTDNIFHLFHVSFEKLFAQPFIHSDHIKANFFLTEHIKTHLFSVFNFSEQYNLAVFMLFFYLINLGLLVISLFRIKKEIFKDKEYIFLLALVVPILTYMRMYSYSPYNCTQAFRYIAPFVLISFGYYIGKGIETFSQTRFPVVNIIMKTQFWIFCASAVLFILRIGFPL